MAPALDTQTIGAVFQSRPDIVDGIREAADSPARVALFNEIASHVFKQLHDSGEPAQKRRRVDVAKSNGANGADAVSGSGNAADEAVLLEIKDISVSAPARKKFELCFTPNFLYARAPGSTEPVSGITYAWRDIEFAFYLPVPDKAQVQHNYVLFPRGSSLPSKGNNGSQPAAEPLVFTVPSTTPKEGTIGGSEARSAAAVSDTYKSLFHWALGRRLKSAGNPVEIVSADANKFHSVIRQAHRPNERAVHVTGFRGSKDGYLFFLTNGILWGFKKPLIFIPLDRIVAVSYTNILQITFNIVVEVFAGEGDSTDEIEFGMLDQQDYGGIDNYIKLNRLQDRSMAEQRKGKLQLAENRASKKTAEDGEDGDGGASAQNGLSELERAQLEVEQQLMDDEDEDEEDYDPGSEGDSEGSGDSSGDDDGDDDDDDDDDGEEDEDEEEDAASEAGGDGAEGDEELKQEEEDVRIKKEATKKGATKKATTKKEATKKATPKKEAAKKATPKKDNTKAAATKKETVKKEAPRRPKAPQAPAQRGWATIGSASRADDMDMDEQFDVVG
ncbi:hypothetical protein CDD83_7095 [Cordyceps sp. RAO-2017]|nr:hypothetical protein CDD83_7095 [Cordyceps sp. RAO-2017]